MKPTNFTIHLTGFLSDYLTLQKSVSKNTILSYRDTFKLLIKYCQENEKINAERITIEQLSKDLIIRFLEWLESERNCSISTRNQRLAAIRSFFRYIQGEEPSGIYHYQKVIFIPTKKTGKKPVEHLSPEAMRVLLAAPDKTTSNGRLTQ